MDVGLQEPLTFDSPGSFFHWLQNEADRWRGFTEGGAYPNSDPVSNLGERGSTEHASEWLTYAQRAETELTAPEARRQAFSTDLAAEISQRILSYEIIYSRSQQGARILSLFEDDDAVARVLVSLSTGRDLNRVIHPSNLRRLWRAMPRAFLEGSPELPHAQVEQVLSEIDLVIAGARDKEEYLGRILREAEESTSTAANEADRLLRERLEVLHGKADAFLGEVQEDWTNLRVTYDRQLALRAPRNYWNARRNAHRIGAAIWGALAASFALFIALALVPSAAEILTGRSDAIAASDGSAAGLGLIQYLPELFQIAVVGFLCLWALRFLVRQSAENLGRLQEASIRVTMVETFLALSNPNEDDRTLVDEADRAVIIQALFRPGMGEGIDDAPPVHWIEDVFRRLRQPSGR